MKILFLIFVSTLHVFAEIVPEEAALQLLENIQKAISTKNQTAYMSLVTRRSSQLPFEELMKLKIPKIPVLPVLEVQDVDIDHYPYMLFFGIVGGQRIGFKAKYSVDKLRYLLDGQSVLDSFIDQEKLAKNIAQNLIERFLVAKDKKSLKMLEDVVADEMILIDCQGRWNLMNRQKYFEAIHRDGLHNFEGFKISKLTYNFVNGTMTFIIQIGDSIKNAIDVQQINGVFLMVLEQRFKC